MNNGGLAVDCHPLVIVPAISAGEKSPRLVGGSPRAEHVIHRFSRVERDLRSRMGPLLAGWFASDDFGKNMKASSLKLPKVLLVDRFRARVRFQKLIVRRATRVG